MPTAIGSGVINTNGGSTTVSASLNIPATGTNRVLIVAVYCNAAAGESVTGVTYNGVAMTFKSRTGTIDTTGVQEFWYMVNPPTGSAFNIVATCGPGTPFFFAIQAQAFNGVDQTTPLGTAVATTGANANSSTATVTLGGSDIALAHWGGYDAASSYTVTPDGTGITEQENGTLNTSVAFQYKASATLGWSMSTNVDVFGEYAIPLKAVGSGSSVTGTGAITSSKATASGAAVEGKTATGNPTIHNFSASGAGVRNIFGTGAVALPKVPVVNSSTGANKSGSGAITSSISTSAGTGARGANDMPGAIDLTFTGALAVSGVGTLGLHYTATGSITSSIATLSGVASKGRSTSGGVLSVSAPSISGAAFIGRVVTGTGNVTSSRATVTGVGALGHSGTGALSKPCGGISATALLNGVAIASGVNGKGSGQPAARRTVRCAHGSFR